MSKQAEHQQKQPNKPKAQTQSVATPKQKRGSLLQRAERAPESLSSHDIQTLQHTLGNDVVARVMRPILQAKMQLGAADDPYEREADQTAAKVMQHINSGAVSQRNADEEELLQAKRVEPSVQRIEDEEGLLQAKPLAEGIQRVEEEGLLQMKSQAKLAQMHGPEGGTVEQTVEQQIHRAKGGGRPIESAARTQLEGGFGTSFEHVRIHTGSQADTLNRSLNARAFTTGNDIFFRSGEYSPTTSGGKQLLAHELTHTLQQSSGRAVVNQSTAIVHRYLDEHGRLLATEKTLDAFFDNGGYDPDLFSQTAYDRFSLAFDNILNLDAEYDDEPIYGLTPLVRAYDALLEDADIESLQEGMPARETACQAGADYYTQHPDADYATAAIQTWPGKGACPAKFQAEIETEIGRRTQAEAAAAQLNNQQVQEEATAYRLDGRLLPGTVNAILQTFTDTTPLAQAKAVLEQTYQAQCTISRQNWLIHLSIAGNPINGTENLHYTTFNDSIADQTDFSVAENTVAELCTKLFRTARRVLRLHATYVTGDDRFHRYWGDGPTGNKRLDDEYTRMEQKITELVTSAKTRHGRVAHNATGKQTIKAIV